MTIKDIAKLSGVGVSTVSRVLNDRPDVSEESRRRVLEVIAEHNYLPNNSARSLVRTKSDTVGLVVRGVQNPFYTDIIRAIEHKLDLAGYTMVMRQIASGDDEVKCGAVMEREDLEAVAEVLRGTNVMVLSDEIYGELNYGLRPHVSIATLPGMAERTIVVNGFSKTYAMTGWRLGYACGPAPIIRIMTKIHQSAIMSAPTTSQYAAITALKECDGEIDRMRDEYNMRRRLVVKSFNDMGLTCFEPRGAFYAFPCIKSTGMSSQDFCTKLLEQKHVAIIPGDAFGASGEGYARISYAYSVEHLKEALKRIREFLQENGIYHGI